ncbi:MAG: hypothetical protein ABIP48_12890 [Planctomycetota bacterium]
MKFQAEKKVSWRVFPGTRMSDYVPISHGVRVLTSRGRFVPENDGEKTWPALWDTGAIITVIPLEFVNRLGYNPSGTTGPIGAFDGSTNTYPWYYVLIGIPGLPRVPTRAIALRGNPGRPRDYVTLGRDVISKLVVRYSSNIPWACTVDPDDSFRWVWRYRRRFSDIFK